MKECFFDYDSALKASMDRFYKDVNPNGLYRVAEYFDNKFVRYITAFMSKRDAMNKAESMKAGVLTKYYITDCKDEK
jgi:hypothetical protein